MNMNFTKPFIMKKTNKSIQSKLGICCALLAISPFSLFATQLKDISYSEIAGGQVQLKIKLDEAISRPSSFITNNPSKIVIDLPNTSSSMGKRAKPIGQGSVRSVTAIEAGSKTRIIIDLIKSVNYTMDVEETDVLVTIGGEIKASANKNTYNPIIISAQSNDNINREIRALDFRRGPGGEGRVIITLSNPATVVDLDRKGGKIIARFENTNLPSKLRQVADVVDFATPVNRMKSYTKGNDTIIEMTAKGKYDYFSYQTNNEYIVEFRKLTKKEQEILKKKESIEYRGDKLSLNFQDIEIRAVLQLLADFTGINMVVSDSVEGNITLRLNDVPWDHALDIILQTNGLAKRQKDNVMRIAPNEEITTQEIAQFQAQKEISELAPLVIEFVKVKYASAKELSEILQSTRTNDLSITDNDGFGGGVDIEHNTSASNSILSDRGQITVDERTNTLLIRDTAENLEQILKVIDKLDIPVRQVLIESRIVLASQNFTKELGIKLGFNRSNDIKGSELLFTGAQASTIDNTNVNTGPFLANIDGEPFNTNSVTVNGNSPLLVNLPAASAITTGGGVNFILGKIGSYLLNLELQALQVEGSGEVVSNPRIITSDSKKASIKQGKEIPYSDSAGGFVSKTQFKKALLMLEVTPHITPDDRVSMELVITKDAPDFTRTINGVPPIDRRRISTNVLVDNGETIVLGGIFESDSTTSIAKVPFFGDVPFIGRLFRSDLRKENQVELLIFITPKILKE